MEKRNVLIITPQVIFPANDGGKQATYYRVLALKRYCNVSLIMVNNADIQVDKYGFSDFETVKVIPQIVKPSKKCNLVEKIGQFLLWLFSNKPRPALINKSRRFQKEVIDFIEKKNISTVVLEFPYSSELIDIDKLHEKKVKLITVLHNVEHLYFAETTQWPKVLADIEYKRIKKYEYDIMGKSDDVVGISPWDVQFIENQTRSNHIKYLPSIFPEIREVWRKNTQSLYITFCGSLSFLPNLQGMQWFIDNVFSQYHKKYPLIKLKITGKINDDIRKKLLQYDNIEFTGYLEEEELKRIILNARFSVVPILKGSGVKMKLLESLSYGVPTITTEHGYQGAPFDKALKSSIPYLVADTSELFLNHMVDLTEGKYDVEKLSRNARNYFVDTYTSDSAISRWLDIIK